MSATSTLAVKSDEDNEGDPSVSEKNQDAPEDDNPLRGHYRFVVPWFLQAVECMIPRLETRTEFPGRCTKEDALRA